MVHIHSVYYTHNEACWSDRIALYEGVLNNLNALLLVNFRNEWNLVSSTNFRDKQKKNENADNDIISVSKILASEL